MKPAKLWAAAVAIVLTTSGVAQAQSEKEKFLDCAVIKTDIMECMSNLSAPFNMMIRRESGACWLGSAPKSQAPTRLTCDQMDYTDLGPRHWFVIKSRDDGYLQLSTVGFDLLGTHIPARSMYFDDANGPSFGSIPEPTFRQKFSFRHSLDAIANRSDYPSNQSLMLLNTGGLPEEKQMVVASGPQENYVFLKADPFGPYGDNQKKDGVDIVPIAQAAGGGLFVATQRNSDGKLTPKEAQDDLAAFADGHRLVMAANFKSEIYPIQTVSLGSSSAEIGLTMRPSASKAAWDYIADEITLIRAPTGGHNGADAGELYLHGASANGAILVTAMPDHSGLVYLTYAPKDGGPRSDVCRTGGQNIILCDSGSDPHTFRLFRSRRQ